MKKRIYKGREVDININSNRLIKQTNKLIEEANKRLIRLTKGIDIHKSTYDPKKKRFIRANKEVKRLTYDFNSWSAKKLFQRLRIDPSLITKVSKDDSESSILLKNKAIKQFLKSETSTIKGIRKTIAREKQKIKDKLEDFDTNEINDKDVETLYDFWYDSDYLTITQYIDPSELWIALNEVSQAGGTSDDFLRYIEKYIYFETLYKDEDLVDALVSIYNKFNK